MSDISIDLHLVWFWPGFALLLLAGWLFLRPRPSRASDATLGVVARVVLTCAAAVAGGIGSWVLAALVGGWF